MRCGFCLLQLDETQRVLGDLEVERHGHHNIVQQYENAVQAARDDVRCSVVFGRCCPPVIS